MKTASVYRKPDDVEVALEKLGLSLRGLREVLVRIASARFGAVKTDARMAAGMFAYLAAVRAMREVFAPDGWDELWCENIEGIFHPELNIRVIYQSCEGACINQSGYPLVTRDKGPAAARIVDLSQGYLFEDMALEAERLAREASAPLWILLVSFEKGEEGYKIAAELSRPGPIENKKFTYFSDRIFILEPDGWDEVLFPVIDIGGADDTKDAEVIVTRKT